jgi:hypothetical protein
LDDHLIDAAYVYAGASEGFSYFRGESERLPESVTWQNIRSALTLFGIYEVDQYTTLFETVAHREAEGIDP